MDRPERLDRPPGLPLGLSSSSGRGLPENPAQGRRAAAAASGPPPPVPPMPSNIRGVPASSSGSLAAAAPLSPSQVIGMARDAMRDALRESEKQAGEANGLKTGLTIDLSRKDIQMLPEEVVDIFKTELERLALSHNRLEGFPARFAECSSLRYLNVRSNNIRDFPLPLCDLKSLEILDLGRNKLRSLPPDIVKLTSLKVFAVQKNRIEELPICLADMASLQVIKLDGNDIRFPPPEAFQVQASSPPNEGFLKESEVTEVTVTSHIKKYLSKQKALNGRAEVDTATEDSTEQVETPRFPIKRVVSGRFPVKVNGTDMPDMRSPALIRPPSSISSHYRGLSQQTATVRRSGVMPLTIGNPNERGRSNSETLLQAARGERPGDRSRRMGIVSKRAQELGTLEEADSNNNRYSYHYRGLSHGSAMQQGNGVVGGVSNGKSPASPAESILQRPVYVRRLSVLPERRRESKYFDPVLETAKGILYSIFQIHPTIQMLMGLTSDGSARRSSLEIVIYNTNSHVEELEREIQLHDPSTPGEEMGPGENEGVHRACVTLVNAYAHVCSLLASNVDLFIDNGDPRYIRTLLVQLYNSIMELRVTTSQAVSHSEEGFRQVAQRAAYGDTIKPHSRESSVTPTAADRPYRATSTTRVGNVAHNPSNLRVATDVPLPMPYINGTGRTATITSATPRSGESFASASSRGLSANFTEEDRLFERIFLALQKSSDQVMRTLPGFNMHFSTELRNSMAQPYANPSQQHWRSLTAKCGAAIQQTEMLKERLSMIRVKEPGIRNQQSFWALCKEFIDAWAELIIAIRETKGEVPLPPDTRARLRPIQQSMKESSDLILRSPWGYWRSGANSSSWGNGGVVSPPVQLPMTPQSAALGPAVQATVPSTPQSASFATAFEGNVFKRADALISNGGLSMPSSRTGTFSSHSSSYHSVNSSVSSQADVMTPSSMLSPGMGMGMGMGMGPGPAPLNQLPFRLNGNKVAF